MAEYHTYATFKRDIDELRALDRAGAIDRTVNVLGTSPDGEWRIPVLKIGRNPDERVMIIGNDHAREWIAGEVPFLLADALVKAANGLPLPPESEPFREQMRTLVDEREIWIAPVINPIGRDYTQNGRPWWRKNRARVPSKRITTQSGDTWRLLFRVFGPEVLVMPPRFLGATHTGLETIEDLIETNRSRVSIADPDAQLPPNTEIEIPTYGVDLNRNYPVHWGTAVDTDTGESRETPTSHEDGYAGREAGSEWEVRAVMGAMNRAKEEGFPFRAALSFHSRAGIVLYPWGYSPRRIEEHEIAELAERMAHRMNRVRSSSYRPDDFARRLRAMSNLNDLIEPPPGAPLRNEYFWAAAGSLHIGGEGGSFMDWVWDQFHIPVFTIEIDPERPSSAAFQQDASTIPRLFAETLPAALVLIQEGGATLPGDALSNTVYVCYLFPWCSRSDLALAWMKNGRFLRRVHWGEDVECTLIVRQPARITSDLEAKFTIVESDVFRFSDDTLKEATLAIPHQQIAAGTLRFAVPWHVGDNQQRNDDAYADASPTVEYQFRVEVDDDVLRSAEIDLVQSAGITWELSDPFDGHFTLVGRFRGMPVQLDFNGTFTILVTYERDSSGYDAVKRFPFDSRVDQQRISRAHETVEVRQVVAPDDLRAPDREQEVREYPFKTDRGIERVNVNLTREPRYAFEFEIVIGGQTFKRRVEDIRIRMFEGTIVSERQRPRLPHAPEEDDARERAYRQRVVTVPNEAVEAVRRTVLALNGGPDFNWWNDNGRAGLGFQLAFTRGILSADRVERQLRAFAAVAASDPEARAVLNSFDLPSVATRFIGFPLQFWSTSDADHGVEIEVSGDGRPASREIITLGPAPVRAANDYNTISAISVHSGELHGVVFAGTTVSDGPAALAINASERRIRYERLNELNDFLRDEGGVLEVTSSDALDRSARLMIIGRADRALRQQVAEPIVIGTTSRTRFFRVTDVIFDRLYGGVLSIRATRDGSTRTLWRNIYDEDIPESILSTYRLTGREVRSIGGRWATYLQMLANAVREHLGIDKEIHVFIEAVTGLRDDALLATTSFNPTLAYHLVAVQGAHVNFTNKSTVRAIAHEFRHAFQRDRSDKLAPGAQLSLDQLGRSTDTFDLRLVKAWKLNSDSGYIDSPANRQDYPKQIREVDSELFAQAVFSGVTL